MWSPFHKRHPVGRARAPSDIASQCLRCSWDMCASLFDCWYLVGRARRARRRLYASNRKMQMICKCRFPFPVFKGQEFVRIDCTSGNPDPVMREGLSTFYLGPVECYDGLVSQRMLGLDKLGSYILVDYPKGTIICSDEPIPFEETSVPLMIIETDWVVRVCGEIHFQISA